MYRITELPSDIRRLVRKKKKLNQYSENMIVYTGRRGLHIFDIDREKWIFNSKKTGYMYEDIYFRVRDIQEEVGSSEDTEE